MVHQNVVSSNINRVGHREGTLFITFKSGTVYSYPGVPRSVYEEMVVAESAGQYFHHHIKNKFAYTKLDSDPFPGPALAPEPKDGQAAWPTPDRRQGERRQAA